MTDHDTTIREAREWRNRLPSNLVSSSVHFRASAFYDAVAHVDELLAVIERQQATADQQAETLRQVRARAESWAHQGTDYDEDTEQQIRDGHAILVLLHEQCTGCNNCRHWRVEYADTEILDAGGEG